jgi:ribosomal protein L16 Arg81 hydroxylase
VAHLKKRPYAHPDAAGSVLPLLQWETLGAILRTGRPDVLTVARGQLVEVPRPRTLDDVQRLMGQGVSVVVRASERHDPGLAALAASFGAVLPGEVHIQVYATPGGTNSYGWHYDFEDVFIAQVAGVKDYYFRDNTVARHTVLGEDLDFSLVAGERSPLMASTLRRGDWLYIPARWWHLVKCGEQALSISIGVMSPDVFRTARRIPAGWSGMRSPSG